MITLADVRNGPRTPPPSEHFSLAEAAHRKMTLAQIELAYIEQVVAASQGNMVKAARLLGIDRRTLYRKLASA